MLYLYSYTGKEESLCLQFPKKFSVLFKNPQDIAAVNLTVLSSYDSHQIVSHSVLVLDSLQSALALL